MSSFVGLPGWAGDSSPTGLRGSSGGDALEVTDGRVYPRAGESFGAFARRVRPSKVSRMDAEWLQVRGVGDPDAEDDPERVDYAASSEAIWAEVDSYMREWIEDGGGTKQVSAAVKEGVWKRVYESAVRHGDVCGKWMLFEKPWDVDRAWEKVASAVGEGMTCSAKVSPCRGDGKNERALICVYVRDWSDAADVRRVLVALKSLGLRVQSGFKADALTMAGLDTAVLKPLRLADSWQLYMGCFKGDFPAAGWWRKRGEAWVRYFQA